jgi:hypothetical protein
MARLISRNTSGETAAAVDAADAAVAAGSDCKSLAKETAIFECPLLGTPSNFSFGTSSKKSSFNLDQMTYNLAKSLELSYT